MKLFVGCCLLYSLIICQNTFAFAIEESVLINGKIAGTDSWFSNSSTLYDSAQSRTVDGSGSFKISNAYIDNIDGYDYVVTKTYPVEPGKLYSFSSFIKSNEAPSAIAGIIINFRDSNVKWLKNTPTQKHSVNIENKWQEITFEFRPSEETAYIQVKLFLVSQNSTESSNIWFDDIEITKKPQPPHLERDLETNLLLNHNVDGTQYWHGRVAEFFDSSESAIEDGSGSFKLNKSYEEFGSGRDFIVSKTYKVTPEKLYTVSAFMKSDRFPAPIPSIMVNFRDENVQWVANSNASSQGVTKANEWQEITTQIRVPEDATYAQVQIFIAKQHTEYIGNLWFDNFYLGEGMTFQKPPSEKTPFFGGATRVDALGNIEIKQGENWQQFIPLCIHADNKRPDWTTYSNQGFNCNMWAGSHLYIQKAKDAVSSFNPNGMMSGLQIANFIIPEHKDYNDLGLLSSRIDEIEQNNLNDSLLFYYWDNENSEINEWDVPKAVANLIKEKNTGHPVYMLQGNEGLTRKYNEIVDVAGDYINVKTYRDNTGFDTLNNIEHQTRPTSIAQLNYETADRFKARVYSALAKGAKGFSVWRDDYSGSSAQSGKVEDAVWWGDIPSIRAELDFLAPLIFTPHWTHWKVTLSNESLDFGTRDYNREGFIILANEHNTELNTTITVGGLSYRPAIAIDYISGEFLSDIIDHQFNVTVPAYGRLVIKLEAIKL